MGLQRARRAKPVAEPLAALTMAAWGGEPGHGSPIGGTRGPRGRFLTLQPAQDGFKPLEIAVTHGFVTMFSGWLLMSPHVRMNCGTLSVPCSRKLPGARTGGRGAVASPAAKSDVTAGCARSFAGA